MNIEINLDETDGSDEIVGFYDYTIYVDGDFQYNGKLSRVNKFKGIVAVIGCIYRDMSGEIDEE